LGRSRPPRIHARQTEGGHALKTFLRHSLSAVEAIAALGLAVTVLKSGTFPSRLRRLSERDGLAPLPRAAAVLADRLVASLAEPVRSKVLRR
jgi:hypothetical protein